MLKSHRSLCESFSRTGAKFIFKIKFKQKLIVTFEIKIKIKSYWYKIDKNISVYMAFVCVALNRFCELVV